MKLLDLTVSQKVVVQIILGEKKLEFASKVLDKSLVGIYISPYVHQDKVLEFNINHQSGIACNLFVDDPETHKRISWKNVDISTKNSNGNKAYYITTTGYNSFSRNDEKRVDVRIVIQKPGKLYNPELDETTNILIHDISDTGISFYASQSTVMPLNHIIIQFSDTVDGKEFSVKLECSIVRSLKKTGMVFYGCRIAGENNKEYLIYEFMKRLKEKNVSLVEN